jgi:protein RecA
MAKRERTDQPNEKLSDQVEKKVTSERKKAESFQPYEGNFQQITSTGSTLLDLAISGGKIYGGGMPSGILVEIFGPPSIGKTSLLCEIAGNVKRNGGETRFHDPEARISTEFARVFGFDLNENEVIHPDTPKDVFDDIIGNETQKPWQPSSFDVVNGIFVDSTAALASDLEMAGKKDEYSRRAKLLSQGFRTSCRVLKRGNYLMVCSNQIRDKVDASGFGEKTDTTGGWAMKFYASLRLKATKQYPGFEIKSKSKYKGREIEKVIGTSINVKVEKSSVWEPFRTAPVYIVFNYGIDDIRANLKYLKYYTKDTVYSIGDLKLGPALDTAIIRVEDEGLEQKLKEETIGLWMEIDAKLNQKRKTKKR